MNKLFLQSVKMHRYLIAFVFTLAINKSTFAQTPVSMASYVATPYTENFTDVGNWTFAALTSATAPVASVGVFSAGTGASAWRGLFASTTSNTALPRQIPDPTKIIQPTSTAVLANNFGMKFQVITSGGLQRNESANATFPAGKLGIVATGTTDSTTAAIADLYLDFTGVAAGTLSFNAEKVTNTAVTIGRVSTLLAYGSVDGTTWVAIPLGQNVRIENTITPQSYTITNASLPAIFNNSATARIRFYVYNGGFPGSPTGSTGNRPRMAIDDISITALAGCSTPITLSNITPASPSIICATNSQALSVTATGATGITYLWTSSTNAVVAGMSSTTTPTISVTPTASTIYTVVASSGSCTASTTFSVTVNPLPTLSVSPSSATVCAGGSATFTATSSSTVSHNWLPITYLNVANAASVVSTPTASIIYTLTITDAAGCNTTALASITYISSVNVSVSSTATTLNCAGEGAVISSTGANSYTCLPAPNFTNSNGSTVNVSPSANTIYTITGSAGACSGTATISIIANNNPLPVLTTSATSLSVCIGSSTTINVSGGSTYTWASAPGLNTTTGASVIVSPNVPTLYQYTATSAAGCSASDTITIGTNALPIVTASAFPSAVCPSGSSTLTATGASTFAWSNGDATATSAVTLGASSSTYTVVGTDVNGCTKSASTTVNILANGARATYGFSTSIPFLGNYDAFLQCNTNIYASGIGFGNQNGTPSNQLTNTSASPTTIGSGGANAGAACLAAGATLNPATSTYFEFTFAPECGKALVLNGLSFISRSTSTGPQSISILTSADNFTTPITTVSSLANSVWAVFNPSFTSVGLTTSDSFKVRIYGSNGNGNGGANAINWRIDDININIGTTTVPTNYPTVTFSPATPKVCIVGTPVTVTASGAQSYNWGTANTTLTNINGGVVDANPTATTTYTLTASNGVCSTLVPITVGVKAISSTTTDTVCSNALPYIWKGLPYSVTGVYYSITGPAVCPDTAILNLTVCQVSYSTASITICTLPYTSAMYSYTFTAYGTDTIFTGTNTCGCPSFVVVTSTPGQPIVYDSTANLCSNFVFPYLGGPNPPYAAFGTYTTSAVGIGGCTVITNFHILPKPAITNTITVVAAVPYVYLGIYTITVNSNTFIVGGGVVPPNIYTFTAANGCDSVVTLLVNLPAVTVYPAFTGGVYLWGPSTGAISTVSTFTGCPNCVMSDSLRVLGLIPTTEPYTALGYIPAGTGGGETIGASVLSVTGQNAIIDWVCIKIRKLNNQTSIYSTEKTVCALLQADGDIVSATDGTSPVRFPGLADGSYNVQINHRNHLGVMTANEVAFSSTTIANVDFTSLTTPLYSLQAPNQNPTPLTGAARIVGAKRYLYAGNCDYTNATNALSAQYIKKKLLNCGNNVVYSDRLELLSNTSGTPTTNNAYSIFDFNFNGKATYSGINSDRLIMQQCVLLNNAIFVHEQTPN